jgi:uncharacterized repeat protein (TIGR03803 family)
VIGVVNRVGRFVFSLGLGLAAFTFHHNASAKSYTVLHAFNGEPGDGALPYASVITDSVGNLYGTTCCGGVTENEGTIFKIDAKGKETLLYDFCQLSSCNDGAEPRGRLLMDSSQNLYGTTMLGGDTSTGVGVVFKLAPDGTETVLHAFCPGKSSYDKGCPDGVYPSAGLTSDASGYLYGTAQYGGAYGGGVIFKIAPDGAYTRLYSFCKQLRCADGAVPTGELFRDGLGNLYGTTSAAGDLTCNPSYGCGTVFQLTAAGKYKVLHTFEGGSDGATPYAGLIADSAGNLFGTTAAGGIRGCGTFGCGTVFKVAPDGTETVLYAFRGGLAGYSPLSELVFDDAGNLYGTTEGEYPYGWGTVFKISPAGKETVLHVFCIDDDYCLHGIAPIAGLLLRGKTLYGTTSWGGAAINGVVFKLPK